MSDPTPDPTREQAEALVQIKWYVACLWDRINEIPVRGLAEAEAGYESALAAVALLEERARTAEQERRESVEEIAGELADERTLHQSNLARVADLERALVRYGQHEWGCERTKGGSLMTIPDCTCGWIAFREALAGGGHTPRETDSGGGRLSASAVVVEALREIVEVARWYANNDQRLAHEVDHALCVEVLSIAEKALPCEFGYCGDERINCACASCDSGVGVADVAEQGA